MGNVYIVSGVVGGGNYVFKVGSTGQLTIFAGTGFYGFSGDGGPALNAQIGPPNNKGLEIQGAATDPAGNLYFADGGLRIRKVDVITGIITTVAGNGTAGFSGDGGPAVNAGMAPQAVSIDGDGNLFIADLGNARIRRVDAKTGIITTVAGNGIFGFNGDNIPAVSASIYGDDVIVDAHGNLIIADSGNSRIRRVDATTGIITTIAGTGSYAIGGDGAPAVNAAVGLPDSVALDAAGNLYISSQGDTVRRVDSATGIISTVAGNGSRGFSGDGGPATAATLNGPFWVAVSGNSLLIVDVRNDRIRSVDLSSGIISTLAGNGTPYFSGDGYAATRASIYGLDSGIAIGPSGALLIADFGNARLREMDLVNGIITSIAGGGACTPFPYTGPTCGDGGPAIAAVTEPGSVTSDPSGNIFIGEWNNDEVRRIDGQTGIISTIVTSGVDPQGVVTDANGNLFIADGQNNRIVRWDALTGALTVIAGNGQAGFFGDGGPAITAGLNHPTAVALDSAGNLLIADTQNGRVRQVDALSGLIKTVAGGGSTLGDGGPAISATINSPQGLALAPNGDLFVSEWTRVREVDSQTGVISTVAGNGTFGFSGDGGPATSAALGNPMGLALDNSGDLFIMDRYNARVRKVVLAFSGLQVSPTALSFGSQLLNVTSSSQAVTLRNPQSQPLTINDISSTGDFSASGNCGSSIPSGGNCAINVTFKPTGLGSRIGKLTVTNGTSEVNVALGGIGSDFSVQSPNSSATVTAGQTASYTVNVTAEGGFSGTISLACSGAPQKASCGLSQQSVILTTGQTAAVTVTVSTSSGSFARSQGPPSQRRGGQWGFPLFAVFLVGTFVLPSRRSRRRVWIARTGQCILLLSLVACGGGGGGGGGTTKIEGTPAGNYTITASATAQDVSRSINLSLIVD